MAKFYGNVGYAETVEVKPGVWKEVITEKPYFGDLIRNSRRLQNTTEVNSGITLNNEISIISDPYAQQNFHAIRYVVYMNTKWIVTNVDVQYPRLILSVGGVYNVE